MYPIPPAVLGAEMFPLRMTPFEAVMLWDDRPAYPMVFWVEVDLRGRLDVAALRKALEIVLPRHPLLMAGVEEIAGFPHWVHAPEVQPAADSLVVSRPSLAFPHSPVGPQWNASVRLTILPLSESNEQQGLPAGPRHRLRFQFHHAAADGIAACIFIGEILATYDGLIRGFSSENRLANIIPHRLLEREWLPPVRKSARPEPPPAAPVEVVPPPQISWSDRIRQAREAYDFIALYPAILAGSAQGDRTTEKTNSHVIGHDCPLITSLLSREQTERIRLLAENVGGLNDVLLAWLFQAMHDWQHPHGSWWNRGTYRITVPANLRPAGERSLSSANCISYAFLDRKHHDCQAAANLLPAIAHATKAIVRYDLSRQFLAFLSQSCRYPAWFRWNVRRGSRMSSSVLSYVGDPSRRFTARLPRQDGWVMAGGLIMERFVGAPPVRPNTRLAIAVTTYRDQLGLAATYDQQLWGRETAQQFLDAYVQLLLQSAEA